MKIDVGDIPHELVNHSGERLMVSSSSGTGFTVEHLATSPEAHQSFRSGKYRFVEGAIYFGIEQAISAENSTPAEETVVETTTEVTIDEVYPTRQDAFMRAAEFVQPLILEHGLEKQTFKPGMLLGTGGGERVESKVDQHLDAILRVADWLLEDGEDS